MTYPKSTFYVFVPGQAVPQGSKTAYVSKSTGRPIVVDKDIRLPRWRQSITAAAMTSKAVRTVDFPLEGPVSATVTFVMVRPRSHYGTGKNSRLVKKSAPSHPAVMPDLDKLLRAVFDGLTDAGVWHDDAQVVWVQTAKKYSDTTPLDGPGVHVWVEPTT